jgi:hypothetical protein
MASEESLQVARDKARNGIIHEDTFNLDMTVHDYAEHLDNMKRGAIQVKIDDLEKQVEDIQRQEEIAQGQQLLQDPRIKKLFKI